MNKRKKGQPAPVWREFMQSAWLRMTGRKMNPDKASHDWVMVVSAEIVRHGDGEAFLKAVRRGRSTMRQNIRYQLLREVEKQMGDAVPRRRPDANTPDSVALKKTVRLELEEFSR